MIVLITIGLWIASFAINLLCAPKHTLAAYEADTGRAKYVLWTFMLLTSLGAWGAEPLTVPRLIIGLGLFGMGTCIAVKALHDNPFFRGDLEPPLFRITTGLYKYFDHPGYLGFSIRFLGVAFIANTAVSCAAALLYAVFLLCRADIEDDLLADL